MKVMISQPMKGKTNEQIRQERADIVKRITEDDGDEVIDTIILEEPPKDCDEAIFYLARSIELMSKADKIIFMEGWEKARGCKIEHQIAVEYEKEILYL